MRKANIPITESAESSLKAFGITLNKWQIEWENLIDSSIKTTKEKLYDTGSFDRFQKQMNSKGFHCL